MSKIENGVWNVFENSGMRIPEESDLIGGATDCERNPVSKIEPVAYRYSYISQFGTKLWNVGLYAARPDAIDVEPLIKESDHLQAIAEATAAQAAEITELRAHLAVAVEALEEARDRFDCLQDYESTGTFMARTGFREIDEALATIKGDSK